jgi:hypothetical protein
LFCGLDELRHTGLMPLNQWLRRLNRRWIVDLSTSLLSGSRTTPCREEHLRCVRHSEHQFAAPASANAMSPCHIVILPSHAPIAPVAAASGYEMSSTSMAFGRESASPCLHRLPLRSRVRHLAGMAGIRHPILGCQMREQPGRGNPSVAGSTRVKSKARDAYDAAFIEMIVSGQATCNTSMLALTPPINIDQADQYLRYRLVAEEGR